MEKTKNWLKLSPSYISILSSELQFTASSLLNQSVMQPPTAASHHNTVPRMFQCHASLPSSNPRKYGTLKSFGLLFLLSVTHHHKKAFIFHAASLSFAYKFVSTTRTSIPCPTRNKKHQSTPPYGWVRGGFLLPGGTHRPLAHPNRFWTGMPSQTWCMSQSLVSMLPFSEVWWVAFIVNGNDEYLVSQSHILCSHSQHHLRPLLPSLHLQRRISPLCQRHLQHISVLGSNVLRGQLIFDTRTPIPWSINCCSRLQTTVAWWKHFG